MPQSTITFMGRAAGAPGAAVAAWVGLCGVFTAGDESVLICNTPLRRRGLRAYYEGPRDENRERLGNI